MRILLTLLITVLVTVKASAQFSENFDQNLTGLSSNCWIVNQFNYSTTTSDVISGTGSAYTNPPTSTSGERTLATPFLNITSTSLNVSFKYKLSSKLAGNATRTLSFGITDRNGVFTSLQTVTMDKHTATTVFNHNATYTVPVGVYRVEIRVGGATGDGNSRVIFDDLYASASAYYGPTIHCNPSAVAIDDNFVFPSVIEVSGNVLQNDQIPNDNEIYSVSVVTAPTSGTLVMNADGTFTFTPGELFKGGVVTFTYQVTDNGYPATTSNIATVTLNFPALSTLPMKLTDFKALPFNENVKISWTVDKIEDGEYFEVERSIDGRNYTAIKRVDVKSHIYSYEIGDKLQRGVTYYRLKMVNRDATVEHSKAAMVKYGANNAELKLMGTTVSGTLNFFYSSATSGEQATALLMDMAGSKISNKNVIIRNNGNYSLDVQQLRPGTYILAVRSDSTIQTARFVKL